MTPATQALMMLALVAAAIVGALPVRRPPTASRPNARPAATSRRASRPTRPGHYAQALAKYEAGYAAKPLPGFLVNIAQCQRRLGDSEGRARHLPQVPAGRARFAAGARGAGADPAAGRLIAELEAAGKAESKPEAASSGDVDAAELAPPPGVAGASAAGARAGASRRPPGGGDSQLRGHAHARWWLWGGIAAAAVAGGVVAGLALSSPENTTIRAGSLGTLSR